LAGSLGLEGWDVQSARGNCVEPGSVLLGREWRNEQLIHPKLAKTVQNPPSTESQAWRPPLGGGPGIVEAGAFSGSVGGRLGGFFSGSMDVRIGEGGVEVDEGVSSGLDIVGFGSRCVFIGRFCWRVGEMNILTLRKPPRSSNCYTKDSMANEKKESLIRVSCEKNLRC
jgi:hypothetical protein